MATREIGVRTIQKALKVWLANGPDGEALDPGPVDGLWGPQTHEALRMFVSFTARGEGLDAARVLAPLRSVPARSRSIQLEESVAVGLTELSRSYEPMVRNDAAADSPTLPVVTGSSKLPMILGVVAGVALFGGAAYYFLRD